MIETLERPQAATTGARLIALCSPAMGSGKSALARFLVEDHGFIALKFAGPLKNMIRSMLKDAGFTPTEVEDMVDGHLKETEVSLNGTPVTSRWLQQSLGTEWGRRCIDENIWVNITAMFAQRCLEAGQSVVIDDMRFVNELEWVNRIGGYPVRVNRPGVVRTTAPHPSEGALDGFQMISIQNDQDLDHLRNYARTLATCPLR